MNMYMRALLLGICITLLAAFFVAQKHKEPFGPHERSSSAHRVGGGYGGGFHPAHRTHMSYSGPRYGPSYAPAYVFPYSYSWGFFGDCRTSGCPYRSVCTSDSVGNYYCKSYKPWKFW